MMVSGEKSVRLARLVGEMEWQLQRPLTADEERRVRLYAEAMPEEAQAEAEGAAAG